MTRPGAGPSLAAIAFAVLASAGPALAAPSPPRPGPERRFSAFLENVFRGDPSVGLRVHVFRDTALMVAGSYAFARREFQGPRTDTTSVVLTCGLRQYLSMRNTRPFLDVEGSWTRDDIRSDTATLAANRDGWGAGLFVGGQHFFVPALSVAVRAGLTARRQDQESGAHTRTITVPASGVALSFHW